MMYSAAILAKNPRLTDTQIKTQLSSIKCRCGTHVSIMRAIKRAAKVMA